MVCVINFTVLLAVKPKFYFLHHDTLSSPGILVQEKVVRAVSQVLCSKLDTARRNKLITTSVTGTMCNLVCCVMCIKLWLL